MGKRKVLWVVLCLALILTGFWSVAWGQILQDYYTQGVERYNRSDFRGAFEVWEQGLKQARDMNNRQATGVFLTNIGVVYWNLGDYPKAPSYYEQALKIHREIGDRKGEGDALGNIGVVYKNIGDYPKALPYYEKALKIKREVGDRKGEGAALGNIGLVYTNLGDYPKALFYYEKALKIKREVGDRKGEGGSLTNIGVVYWNLGDYPKALTYYEKALKIDRKIGNRKGEGAALTNIGIVYDVSGDYPKALTYYEKSLKIVREIGNRKGEGESLTNIGLVYSNLGDYPKALTYYEKSLKIDMEIGNRKGEGADLNNIGLVYSNLGDYSKALTYYEKALKIDRKIGNRKGEGVDLNNIGLVYSKLGDYPKALTYYEKTLKIGREIGVPTGIQEANMGDIYLEQDKLQDALMIFKRLNAHIRLGRYYLRIGDYQRARQEFTQRLKTDEKQKNANFLVADYIGLGLSSEGLKDYPAAGKYYQKGVALIERQRESLAEPQRRNFFVAKVMGFSRLEPYEGLVRVSHFLKEAGEAFFWAENSRGRLLLEAVARRSSGERLGIPGELSLRETALVGRIAAVHKQMDIAFEKNRERYRELEHELAGLKEEQETLIARLKRDYPEYAAIRYPQPIPIKELKLQAGEVLIEYEVTEKASFAWLVRSGKVVKAITIPVDRKALIKEVKAYRGFFESVTAYDQLSRFDPRLGKKLYDLLFKDMAPLIKKGEKLVLIPDEILGILPFEALVVALPAGVKTISGQYGACTQGIGYLGDLYPISYYQSATALSLARTLKRKGAGKSRKMLVVADPVFNVADSRLKGNKVVVAQTDEYRMRLMRAVGEDWQGGKGISSFPRLQTTGRLAEKLHRSYGKDVDILKGVEATEEELRRRPLRDYRYQVFATHGILDDEVPYIKEPALVLSQVGVDTTERAQDGFLTMTEMMGLKLGAEIVVLTACNTGIGKNLTGEGVMGMGRSFQYAGAKSVLMSLWSVEDESTNKLTEKFFTYLKQGKKKIEALKLARADIRKAGYKHPFFWASFVLVGER